MRIYFARHGESQANVLHEVSNRGTRHPLTFKGRQQAAALAQSLQSHPISRVYSSPLLRAVETSIIVANRLEVEYEIIDALREYDCGILEGRSDEAAWQRWRELFNTWMVRHCWDERIEGGESFNDLKARFEPFIQGLVLHHGRTETELVCVSHGGLYWMMLPLIMKNVDETFVARYRIDFTTCIVAELRSEGLYCVEWNGHPVV
jgi:broad specificity phosphatase PhoE